VSSRSILQPGANADDRARRPLAAARGDDAAAIQLLGRRIGRQAFKFGERGTLTLGKSLGR
jgi:hypothetical protein